MRLIINNRPKSILGWFIQKIINQKVKNLNDPGKVPKQDSGHDSSNLIQRNATNATTSSSSLPFNQLARNSLVMKGDQL